MNNNLKAQLSTNYNNFEELISAAKIYVDKTQHIHRMLTEGKNYFLSRPRRFGKSLLLSTLQALFEGKKELFKDTYIHNTDYDWQQYPMIHMDMSETGTQTIDQFETDLYKTLEEQAETHGITMDRSVSLGKAFSSMIRSIALKHHKQVVILIDEYDAPILNKITNLAQAEQVREILKSFYTVLKSQNHHIKFLFITGVTRFSHVSIFSGLNNLKDLSMKKEYADFLGYTQEELEQSFSEHIAALAQHNACSRTRTLHRIREWYNGYRFSRQEVYVYNPYSTLNLFDDQEFLNYWFTSGTPSFLVHMLRDKSDWQAQDFESQEVASVAFDSFDLENLDLTSVLLQTGYLTIKDYAAEFGGVFTVGHPNKELHESFMRSLVEGISGIPSNDSAAIIFQMSRSLMAGEVQVCIEAIKTLFKKIPYPAYLKQERDYRNIIYAVQVLLGADAQMEVHTNKGRIDTAIETPKHIYIFEYKINQTAQEALNQIKDKKYYEPYEDCDKKIWLVGINFSETERNIDDELIEEWRPRKS